MSQCSITIADGTPRPAFAGMRGRICAPDLLLLLISP
jgi:hypothetical protein